jgi:hypothetical protein
MAMVSLRVNIIANGYKYLHVAPNSHQVAHMRARTLSKVAERAWGGEVANPLLELRAAIVPAPRRSLGAFFAQRPVLRWVVAPASRYCYRSARYSLTARLIFMLITSSFYVFVLRPALGSALLLPIASCWQTSEIERSWGFMHVAHVVMHSVRRADALIPLPLLRTLHRHYRLGGEKHISRVVKVRLLQGASHYFSETYPSG